MHDWLRVPQLVTRRVGILSQTKFSFTILAVKETKGVATYEGSENEAILWLPP